jgi:hypothetical protein
VGGDGEIRLELTDRPVPEDAWVEDQGFGSAIASRRGSGHHGVNIVESEG